ncbi:MAG TPA: hypothetical protein VH877_11105 [Polyangia bacterium]|nr:hypothetical protein [Polyangia bacterium]
MRRAAVGLCLGLLCAATGGTALAQDKPASPPATEPGDKPAAPPGDEPAQPPATPPGEAAQPPGEQKAPAAPPVRLRPPTDYRDIFAVQRRPVLKRKRVEILPTYNLSINNPLVRHHGFGGIVNIYLSEALFVGVEGTYYAEQILNRYYLISANQGLVPSANQYVWSAFAQFGYIPLSGKFAFFNRLIGQWELWVSGGIGVFRTEIIPRNVNPNDPASQPFSNYVLSGLLPSIGMRVWLSRWLGLDAYFKNYLFADRLENVGRRRDEGAEEARRNSVSQLTYNVTFGVGFSIFLPPRFEYRTPR